MSTELALLDGDNALRLTPAELQRGIAKVQAELGRRAGSLVGEALKQIIGAYPVPKDFANPHDFLDQAILALEDFPALIIEEMADPKVGIVREQRYLPRIAELVGWCEKRIRRYESACFDAQEAIMHQEREATIRQMQEEAAAAARESQAREEAARELEPEVLKRLKALPTWTRERRPRVGEERAKDEWQAAMARSLARRPKLVEPYLEILAEHPALLLWATEQENAYRGSGWPKLSHRMLQVFEGQTTVGAV